MGYFFLYLFIFIGLVLITRPFTTLFHELGHAIVGLLITKQKTTIYLGSYGDPNKSKKIQIGLLEIWFRYDPFSWDRGICIVSQNQMSINSQILYTLAGPVASLLIAVPACYISFAYDFNDVIRIVLLVFVGSSLFDLFVNLNPSETPVKLFDGSITYNDGYSLKWLFYYKRLPESFSSAVQLFNENKFTESSELFDQLLAKGFRDEHTYRLAIVSHLQAKNHNRAKTLNEEFMRLNKMNSDDFANGGLIHSMLDQHETAMEFYEKSLALNPENKFSLNNKGFTLNIKGKYEEAILLFDKVIAIDNTFAHAFNNRGLSKFKTGNTEEGLKDIHHSLQIDKDNPYAYRNLGIYHSEKGEWDEAMRLFMKAKEIDANTKMLEELITRAQQALQAENNSNSKL